ncbi:hypothetical protein ACFQ9J_13980 [Streptomyces sp. NPDC056529]|uniref:hypothetical protein n=1 Tax=Streptomyces sp. NPDC056529 TaxID=3345855 RepID=UPI00369EC755
MALNQFLQIMMASVVLLILAAVIGIITFGIARMLGASRHSAVGAGGLVLGSTLTIGIAMFSFMIPLLL